MKTAFRQRLPGVAAHAMMMVAIVMALAQPARAASVPQLMEDTALTKAIQTPLSTATEVCETDAMWIRLNFKQLQMSQYDSLTLTSSGGDTIAFDGRKWNNQQFSTRALRGNCVQVRTFFGSSTSRFQIDSYQYGTRALEETTVTVAGVGDICDSDRNCSKTAALIADIAPVAVFTAGDNAYEDGALAEYNGDYDDYWGPFKNYTKPTPGNHEYYTTGAKGYFDYFNGSDDSRSIAGERGKGYYSWDVGDWRFIALNSNISMSAGSAQETWLRQNLAASTKPCTAAVFHHPLISRGRYTGTSGVKPLWDALYDYKADLILVGHDHNYQRYAKADPSLVAKSDGIRQILIGTGGRSFYALSGTHPLLQASNDETHGVLKLTLSATGYTADFVPVAGSSFTDTVSAPCNAKPGSTAADFGVAALPDSPTIARGATSRSTLTVASSGGFSGAVTLSLTGLPSGVTYSLSPNPVSVGANASASATLTLTASGTASLGSFPVTVNAVSGSLSRSTAFTLTVTGSTAGSVLTNGVAVSNLSAALNAEILYTMNVPAGASNLVFTTTGGTSTSDADLYVKFGTEPTASEPRPRPSTDTHCVPYQNGSAETCTFPTPRAGTWYIKLRAFKAFSGVTLKGSYSTGTVPSRFFENTADYSIPDYTATNYVPAESKINVSGISGNAPSTLKVNVTIRHTYSGDLTVDLIAPNGTRVKTLWDREGGSTDDIVKSFTVDASAFSANGTWTLRVKDNDERDTGRIDAWSLQF